jgi:hypothetical protein
VGECFGFLEAEYGCRQASTRDEGREGIFVRYRNATPAVEVGYEPTEEEIAVFLVKLEASRVPSYLDAW